MSLTSRSEQEFNAVSVFTGVGGFDVALEGKGVRVVAQVEKDRDCLAVLQYHYPHILRIHDVKDANQASLNLTDDLFLLAGGSPCQDLSTAGKRAGLQGDQSGLWYEFHRLLRELKPKWFIWENVPGVLSSGSADPFTGAKRPGLDFAIVLAGFTGVVFSVPEDGWRNSGIANGNFYNVAWRVLDAQFFGVAQRRRRVFVVGCLSGCGISPAEVLFEREGMSWNPPPRRPTRARPARQTGTRPAERDKNGTAQSEGGRAADSTTSSDDAPGSAGQDEALAFGSTGQGWYEPGIQTLRERDYKGDANLVAQLHGGSHELTETEGMAQVPYNVLGVAGNAKQRHAYPTETANTLDTWAGVEDKNAGGTFIVTDADENEREDVAPTLFASGAGTARTASAGSEQDFLILVDHEQARQSEFEDVAPTLIASGAGTNRPAGMGSEAEFLIPVDHGQAKQDSFRLRAFGDYAEDDVASTTLERDHKYITDIITVEALDVRNLNSEGDLSGTLQTKANGGYSLNYQNPIILSTDPGLDDDTPLAFMAGQGAKARSVDAHDDLSPTLRSADSGTNQTPTIARSHDITRGRYGVRRLLPVETERLQGFEDNWTKYRANGTEQSDTNRYRQMGNAVAVPVVKWIVRRLVAAERAN